MSKPLEHDHMGMIGLSEGSGVTLFGQKLDGNLQNGLSIGSLKTSVAGEKKGFS